MFILICTLGVAAEEIMKSAPGPERDYLPLKIMRNKDALILWSVAPCFISHTPGTALAGTLFRA